MKCHCLLILLLVAGTDTVQASERPNIVLIVADDLGETEDLSEKKPALVKGLATAWATWEAGVNKSAKVYAE